jgi:hypothetical protein
VTGQADDRSNVINTYYSYIPSQTLEKEEQINEYEHIVKQADATDQIKQTADERSNRSNNR